MKIKKLKENINLVEADEKITSEAELAQGLGKQNEIKGNSIGEVLDLIAENNIDNIEYADYFQPINILIIGEPGGGKSSIIENWAKNRNFALLTMTGSSLTDTLVQGLPIKDETQDESGKKVARQVYLPSTAFDKLDDENGRYSILFLDELNRSWPEAEGAILNLIQSHKMSNYYAENGMKHYKKFLFTIAAVNPPSENKEVRRLSHALNTRFKFFIWNGKPEDVKDFWVQEYDKRIEKANKVFAADNNKAKFDRVIGKFTGRKNIIKALIDSGDFAFSDTAENGEAADNGKLVLNARTLASCLENCNGKVGTPTYNSNGEVIYPPGTFLGEFKSFCGEKTFEMVEEILAPISEAEDEANGYQKTCLEKYNKWKLRNKNKF